MCDDKRSSARKHCLYALLHKCLRVSVNARGCLVKYEYLRLAYHRSRKGDELSLTVRKPCSTLIDFSIIALFKLRYEVMRMNGPGSLNNLLVRGIKLSVTDIVLDCSRKQEIVLRHYTHLLSEALKRHRLHIRVIDKHPAPGSIVKTAYKVDYG